MCHRCPTALLSPLNTFSTLMTAELRKWTRPTGRHFVPARSLREQRFDISRCLNGANRIPHKTGFSVYKKIFQFWEKILVEDLLPLFFLNLFPSPSDEWHKSNSQYEKKKLLKILGWHHQHHHQHFSVITTDI